MQHFNVFNGVFIIFIYGSCSSVSIYIQTQNHLQVYTGSIPVIHRNIILHGAILFSSLCGIIAIHIIPTNVIKYNCYNSYLPSIAISQLKQFVATHCIWAIIGKYYLHIYYVVICYKLNIMSLYFRLYSIVFKLSYEKKEKGIYILLF